MKKQLAMLQRKIDNKTAKVCVIGLGYVGLPAAVYCANAGFEVAGVDLDKRKIELIAQGKSPLSDSNLTNLLKKVIKTGKLKVSSDDGYSVAKSDVIQIIVPTPIKESKEPDLGHIESAASEVAKGLKKGQLVILESTVYPGITENLMLPILEQSGLIAGKDFGLAYVPERYNPGDPLHTLDNVSRIVGAITPEWAKVTQGFYQSFIKKEVVLVKDIKTAEAAKIIENIQRDLNIALMNELALIFERLGIDVYEVIEAASSKWNFVPYYPGGVGGHCLPHDPYYLTKRAQEVGYIPRIILAGRAVNDTMPHHIYGLVVDALNQIGRALKGSKILILGASYKKNTDDLRTSPTESLIKELYESKAQLYIVEPYVESDNIFGCKNFKEIEKAPKDIDGIVLMIDHDAFCKWHLKDLKEKFEKTKIVFVDGRRAYHPLELKKYFIYRGIGAGGYNE